MRILSKTHSLSLREKRRLSGTCEHHRRMPDGSLSYWWHTPLSRAGALTKCFNIMLLVALKTSFISAKILDNETFLDISLYINLLELPVTITQQNKASSEPGVSLSTLPLAVISPCPMEGNLLFLCLLRYERRHWFCCFFFLPTINVLRQSFILGPTDLEVGRRVAWFNTPQNHFVLFCLLKNLMGSKVKQPKYVYFSLLFLTILIKWNETRIQIPFHKPHTMHSLKFL